MAFAGLNDKQHHPNPGHWNRDADRRNSLVADTCFRVPCESWRSSHARLQSLQFLACHAPKDWLCNMQLQSLRTYRHLVGRDQQHFLCSFQRTHCAGLTESCECNAEGRISASVVLCASARDAARARSAKRMLLIRARRWPTSSILAAGKTRLHRGRCSAAASASSRLFLQLHLDALQSRHSLIMQHGITPIRAQTRNEKKNPPSRLPWYDFES